MTASLLFAIELTDREAREAYFKWADRRIMAALQVVDPARYQVVVEKIRSYILDALSSNDNR